MENVPHLAVHANAMLGSVKERDAKAFNATLITNRKPLPKC